jgi:DNA-binding response OmpR family regulator
MSAAMANSSTKRRVLVVDDEENVTHLVSSALRFDGFETMTADSGTAALHKIAEYDPDLVVLDVMMPGRDGFGVLQELRASGSQVPVIFLTARDAATDRVSGLRAGADDYVVKPFRVAELLARVRALVRRGAREHRATEAGGVRVDPASRRAWQDGRELDLTPKEFDLLALLVSEAGTVVRRDRIMREVWDENWFGSTKTLDMHVSWLRRKLGDDAAAPRLIVTVRGVGLRFEA